MNKSTIVTETELLTDLRFYSFLTKADFGDKPPLVTNLMADSLHETDRKCLDKAVAMGLLRLEKLELEDLQSMPNVLLDIGVSFAEAYSLWYAAQYDLVAIGYSRYWQKIKFKGIKIISHKEPEKLFGEMRRLHTTTNAAERRLSMRAKQKQRR